MSKLEERIKYYESRIEFFTECLSGKLSDEERAVYEGKMGCYKTILADLQSLTSSHREEIEKAYKAGEGDGAMVAMFPSTDNPPLVKFKSATDYYEKTFGTETPEKFKSQSE